MAERGNQQGKGLQVSESALQGQGCRGKKDRDNLVKFMILPRLSPIVCVFLRVLSTCASSGSQRTHASILFCGDSELLWLQKGITVNATYRQKS